MLKPLNRIASTDLLRGVAVVLLIVTHIWLTFFSSNTNPVGTVISYVGSYISFTLFLVASGFILGFSHRTLTLKKVLIRAGLLIAAYLILGVTYNLLQKHDVLSLFTTPIYLEEYLLPLAIFPIIAYTLIHVSRRVNIFKKILTHSVGSTFVLLIGLSLVVLGKYIAADNTNFLLSWLVGAVSFHTFPLISYLVVYGVGLWLGWSYKVESVKNYGQESMIVVLVTVITSVIAAPLEHLTFSAQTFDTLRWPPTLFFIASSLAISVALVYTATLFEEKHSNPVSKVFRFIGKYAMYAFVLHLLFIYLVQGIVLAKVPTPSDVNPTPSPTPLSEVDRITPRLTAAYEQKDTWPFPGYKVAVIPLDLTSTHPGPAHVEIRTEDVQALSTGADITVYALTQDQAVKKVMGKVASIGTNTLTYNLTIENGFTDIIVAFSENNITQALQTAQNLLTKGAKASGSKLATIDKNFTNWSYKPYAMSGQRWFVKNSSRIEGTHNFKATLPITCADMETFLTETGGELIVKRDQTTIKLSDTCVDLVPNPKIPTTYTQAKAVISVPLDLDMKKQSNGKKTLTYTLSLTKIDGDPLVFTFQKNVIVSDPMYVAWTLDWEGFAAGSSYLGDISTLRNKVPMVKVTHMFNPRLWNSSSVSKASADAQIAFVKNGVSKFKDDISLHLHLYNDLVAKAGVTQITKPGWNNRTDGYDKPFSEFTEEDATKILSWAVNEFPKKGLPKPTAFRAGGWMIDLDGLRAMATVGLKVDTSGRTAFKTSLFGGSGHPYIGPWTLSITTQPFWISKADQNKSSAKANSVGVYEIPDNGGDSWAFSVDALLLRFKNNFTSDIPTKTKLVTYITHPDFFYKEGPKMSDVMQTISKISADTDDGPVVFTTLKEYYENYAK